MFLRRCVVDSHVDRLLRTDKRIFVYAGVVLMALRTPLAVFRATTGARVNDGAGLEMVSTEMAPDVVGHLVECLFLSTEGCPPRLI